MLDIVKHRGQRCWLDIADRYLGTKNIKRALCGMWKRVATSDLQITALDY